MAGRIRSIKPEILEDERSAALSDPAWRLWVSMWLLADDHGRLRGSGDWLKAMVFWSPLHSGVLVDDLLEELSSANVIVRYVVNGQRYIEIKNWTKHQKVDHPSKPRIPGSDQGTILVSRYTVRESSETLAPDLRSGPPTSDQDHRPPDSDSPSAHGVDEPAFDFDAVYAIYPRKEGKKKGLQRCRSQIKTRLKYDALLTAVKNYSEHVIGRDPDKVKQFDTFIGCWEDYVNAMPRANSTRNGRPVTSSAINQESRQLMAEKW